MSYHRNFNNTLAIWAAFGGRGELILPIPTLSWQRKYYNDFGYTQYGSERQINVYDNGNAQVAVYPNPENIIWMEDWGKYALFNESMLYVSADGLTWEGVEQPGFTTTNSDTFGGAIYVPGDGFYVKASGYVYYAPY